MEELEQYEKPKVICNEKVSFSNGTWVTLIGMIAGGVGTNLILIYSMGLQIHSRIDSLDNKWQERVMEVHSEFRSDIKDLSGRIPPDWFRKMVEQNSDDIQRIENEFTRDFVRHSELEKILDQKERE